MPLHLYIIIIKMFEQSHAFFELPVADKRKVLANKLNRGYTAYEEEVGN